MDLQKLRKLAGIPAPASSRKLTEGSDFHAPPQAKRIHRENLAVPAYLFITGGSSRVIEPLFDFLGYTLLDSWSYDGEFLGLSNDETSEMIGSFDTSVGDGLYVFTVNGNAKEALELLKKSKGNVIVNFE